MTSVATGVKEPRTLEKNSPRPLYAQLEEVLRADLFSKKYAPNEMIPSELELSRTYGVSRMTARAVVTQLVNEGLLRRVQGKGTFVIAPKISAKSLAYMGIREQLESLGYSTSTRLIDFKRISAGELVAKQLGVTVGDRLFFVKRLRLADSVPISLHLSYLPQALCPTLVPDNLETEQLCVILSRDFNLVSASTTETLESVVATTAEAKHLAVERRFPLLLLDDVHRTASNRAFEYTRVLFRGDKIKLHFEYAS
jgi:GntR family transcriptional regulator